MSNIVQIKRGTAGGSTTPSTLAVGELAWAENGQKLFIGESGSVVTIVAAAADHTKLAGIGAGANVSAVNGYTGNVTLAKADVGLGNVPNESKATMFSSPTFTGTVSGVTAAMVGLGNVDNTSDVNKPVSTAQASAIALKANIASPTFTGTVSGITASMVGAPSGSGTSTGSNTGDQDLSGLVTKITTVNGHALSGNVTVTASDVGLGNVTNESKATMFTSPTFTGTVTLPTSTPSSALEAASKGYVDSVATGLTIKDAVAVSTTTSGTLATSFANGQVIDGHTLVTGERVLIKNQATGSENGIYVVNATGAPTRAGDFDNSPSIEVKTGDLVYVSAGSANGGTQWVLTTTGTITLGSTALTFAQFGGGGLYSAGSGLALTGSVFSIDGTVLTTSSTLDVTKFSSGTAAAFNGSNVTNLNATSLASGTVADARLTANVLFITSTIDGGTF
jgi:hypothetical protein